MQPASHPAARRERFSHDPIPYRQLRSVRAPTCPCPVRATRVRAVYYLHSLTALKISYHDLFTYTRQIIFHWETVWDWLAFFFECDCLPERVSRSLLGTAESEEPPAKLTRFFWKRAPPTTG